jgi:hypothetical protein
MKMAENARRRNFIGECRVARAASCSRRPVGLPDPCTHPDDFAELHTTLTIIDTPTPIAYVLASNELDLEALLD